MGMSLLPRLGPSSESRSARRQRMPEVSCREQRSEQARLASFAFHVAASSGPSRHTNVAVWMSAAVMRLACIDGPRSLSRLVRRFRSRIGTPLPRTVSAAPEKWKRESAQTGSKVETKRHSPPTGVVPAFSQVRFRAAQGIRTWDALQSDRRLNVRAALPSPALIDKETSLRRSTSSRR